MSKEQYEERRFAAKTQRVIDQANAIMAEYAGQRVSLRQLHYQFVARDFYENTSQNYKKLGDILRNARMAGKVSWSVIEDRGRSLVGSGSGWDSPAQAMRAYAHNYEEDLWNTSPVKVEIWTEKDALSSVIRPVAREFRVNFFASKGYPSVSSLKQAADRFNRMDFNGQEVFILFLSDHDPEGLDMARQLEEIMETFGVTNLTVKRLGLTMEQINQLNPPSSFAKAGSSRLPGYIAETGSDLAWELDALPTEFLQTLIGDALAELKDDEAYEQREREQQANRDLIIRISDNYDRILEFLGEDEDDDDDDDDEWEDDY
jgi:hypothetical protein